MYTGPAKVIALRIATHNVLSVLDASLPADMSYKSSVAQALELQYHQQNLHIICVQEGRRPQFAKPASHYFVVSSGSL